MKRVVIALVLAFCAVPALAEPSSAPPPTGYGQSMGRSGFWTSPYPAKNGAYRYRLLGIGCALALGMGLLSWRLVKNARAFRADRDATTKQPPES
jgi:hypothetical protein